MTWEPKSWAPRIGERTLFPALSARAYLNHAAIAPPSQPVVEAVNAYLADYARYGVGAFPLWHPQRDRLRAAVATLIGSEASEIGFVSNTTASVITVARCFPWKRGDRILCFTGEFPTNVTPWQQAARSFGLEVVLLDAACLASNEGWQQIEAVLANGVRLVAVSAVQFQTGQRTPLKALAASAHREGAQVFVDAIQACGVVPIDVRDADVDYLGCGSHKWLMGMEGLGFLYVKTEHQMALEPNLAGWLSHEEPIEFLFTPGALRYDRPIRREISAVESGMLNGAGSVALEAAISLIQEIGVPAIHAHVNAYHDRLEPELIARGFRSERASDSQRRSGTLSVVPPSHLSLADLSRALDASGISVSTPDGHLRFAPHWPNALDEIPDVLKAVDQALAE